MKKTFLSFLSNTILRQHDFLEATCYVSFFLWILVIIVVFALNGLVFIDNISKMTVWEYFFSSLKYTLYFGILIDIVMYVGWEMKNGYKNLIYWATRYQNLHRK